MDSRTIESSSSPKPVELMDLGAELLRDILLRLPVNSLIKCRRLCRRLRQIITEDPRFARLHFARSSEQFLLQSGFPATLNLFELERFQDDNCPRTKCPLPTKNLIVLNSCNGFLCLGRFRNLDPRTVFNPVTGEYLNLPITVTPPGYDKEVVFSGFGYSSRTHKYKVVRLISRKVSGKRCRVTEVCTLGEESWRRIGIPPRLPRILGKRHPFLTNGVFLNGFFHWIFVDHARSRASPIVSFDFDNEMFGTVLLPPEFGLPFIRDWTRTELGVLQGRLYINNNEMWVMTEYGVQASWNREYPSSIMHNSSLVKRLDNERLLLNYGNSELRWCTAIAPPPTYFSHTPALFRGIPEGRRICTVVHVPSFISLRDIVQSDVQVRRV